MRSAVVGALVFLATLVSSGFASTVPVFLWSPGHDIVYKTMICIAKTIATPIIAEQIPKYKIDSVEFETLTLGTLPPTFHGMKVYSTDEKELIMETSLKWAGNPNFTIAVKAYGLRVTVQVVDLTDLGLVFVGRELQSDISRNKNMDPALLNLLKDSYMKSNLSLAFPYVAALGDESMETSLVSGFTETCDNDLELKNIAFLGSCSIQIDESRKISDLKSLHDYLVSRKERRLGGHADVIMFCQGESSVSEVGFPSSEGEILSELLRSMEQLDEKYSVLYVSDPSRSIQYHPYPGDLDRFLAESTNGSSNSTCDGVCQIKSSLLEGLVVGIVLLVILISGLCCMAGIQTPTRFETPHES